MTDRRRSAGASCATEFCASVGDAPLLVRDVVVVPVTPHAWRVSDQRRPDGDPRRLLAFVERRGTRFEVMQLGSRFEWTEFDTLEQAVSHVCESGPRLARERLLGDLAWIR